MGNMAFLAFLYFYLVSFLSSPPPLESATLPTAYLTSQFTAAYAGPNVI